MGDLELILLVLAAFYVGETAHWLLPGSVLFVGHGGRRLRPRLLDTTATFRNAGGGVLFGSLLPWGEAASARPYPLSLGTDGVLGFTAHHLGHDHRPTDDGRFLPWNEVRNIAADGRSVLVDGAALVRVDLPRTAAAVAEDLKRLASLKPERREKAIDSLIGEWFDDKKFTEEQSRLRSASRGLQFTNTLLFAYFFILLPLMIWYGLRTFFLEWLIGYGAVAFLNIAVFYITHRRLFRERRGERWKRLLMMLISPADAARSRNHLFRDAAATKHPLCAAVVWCSDDDTALVAERTLRDLDHPQLPVCRDGDARSQQVEAAFRDQVADAARKLLERRGLDARKFTNEPTPESTDSRSFCSRCTQQFREPAATCNLCGLSSTVYAVSPAASADAAS